MVFPCGRRRAAARQDLRLKRFHNGRHAWERLQPRAFACRLWREELTAEAPPARAGTRCYSRPSSTPRFCARPSSVAFSATGRSWPKPCGRRRPRSEEHTSELPAPKRLSYRVLFLTKKIV